MKLTEKSKKKNEKATISNLGILVWGISNIYNLSGLQ